MKAKGQNRFVGRWEENDWEREDRREDQPGAAGACATGIQSSARRKTSEGAETLGPEMDRT